MMVLFLVFMRVLSVMFAIGAIGCVIVLVLTTIDDVAVLFDKKSEKTSQTKEQPVHQVPASVG
jgi:hypothetical protein